MKIGMWIIVMAGVGGEPATPWTPAEITTALWLDADDDDTITLNGSTVSEWRDKSGNEYDVYQTTPSYQPTKVTGGVQFDGTDDRMTIPDVPQALGQQIIAVVDTTNLQSGTRVFLNRSYTGSPYPPALYFGDAGGGGSYYPSVYWGTTWANRYVATVKRLAIYGFSILSGSTEIRIDGGAADSATTAQTVLTAWNELNTAPTYSQQAAFVLKELVIFNSTDTATRQKVEGYLAHKWALTGLLPSDHPYKSAAPTV